ncbi:MFS transporter [Lactobacillus sp. ESL0263]|uniref:MFS transporter n=1 Tax=Lactobacillus sp. ESL0263 TaxID=2069350 RepID=UPI000EFD4A29|nr:MFS transporter [Lactobacillus sp. ESL0263]RMC48581.1 MFS transporter [Lactobacillus sp. ESL0263]
MSNKQKIYPWLMIVTTGLLCGIVAGVFTQVMGLFLTPLANSIGGGKLGSVSYYYTVLILATAVGTTLVGKFIHKVNVSMILLGSIVVAAVSTWLFSMANSVIAFYILAAIVGICCGFSGYVVQGVVINNWFVKRKNFAFTAGAFFNTIFLAVITPVASQIIQSNGWRRAFIILAIIMLVIGIPCSLFTKVEPAKLGLLPYGVSSQAELDQINDDADAEAGNNSNTSKVLFSLSFVLVLIFFCFNEFAGNMTSLWPSFAEGIGFGANVGGLIATIITVADLAMTPLFGVTTDHFGGRKALPWWLFLTILAPILMIIANQTRMIPLALAAAIPADAISVVMGSGEQVFAKDILGKDFDAGYSYASSITYVVSAFATPVLSNIADATHNWNIVVGIVALCELVVLLAVIYGENRAKRLAD